MAEADHKTTIKIDGDSKGAKSAIESTSAAIRGLSVAVSRLRMAFSLAMTAVGTVVAAFHLVPAVIDGWKKLADHVRGFGEAAGRAFNDRVIERAEAAVKRLVGRQRELNAELEKQARLNSLKREVEETRASVVRDAEDGRRAVARATELAGVTDPRRRQAIQDRFAAEDARRQADEDKRQREQRIADLRKEIDLQAEIQESRFEQRQEVEAELKRQREILATLEAWKKPDQERIDAQKKRIKALEDEDRALHAAFKAATEAGKAASMRLGALTAAEPGDAGATVAGIEARARWERMDRADKASNAEFLDGLAKNEAESAWRRHYASLTDEVKVKALDQREDAARERMAAAQNDLSEEMEKDVEQRDEERIQRARATIRESQSEALDAAESREDLERSIEAQRESDAQSRADDLASTFANRGNRLTAMGLGDGSGPSSRTVEDINGKLTSVLDVLRQELDAMRGMGGAAVAEYGA